MSGMLKTALLTATVAVASLVEAAPLTLALPVTFDPDGLDPAPSLTVTSFEFGPGNVLAIGGATPLIVGQTIDVMLQTHLVSFNGGTAFLPPGNEITMLLRALEVVVSITGPTVATKVVSGGGYLKLFRDSTPNLNDTSGTGFDDGQPILDMALPDGGASLTNLSGIISGPADLSFSSIGSKDPAFFLSALTTPATFTTNLTTSFIPGTQASAFPAFGVTPTAADARFQSLSELRFEAVPEPSPLSLIALGAVLLSACRRPRISA